MRTFLWHERARLPQVAFAATLGARGDARTFEQMRRLAGRAPLAVHERDLEHRAPPRSEVARFAAALVEAARRGRQHGKRARAGEPRARHSAPRRRVGGAAAVL